MFKKFADQPRRKTNFTTKRGVRDVTLVKRPLTQSLANRSCCLAQAVGCCKNVCFFVERSDARQGTVIRFVVLQKSVARVIHEELVGNTGGIILFPTGVSKRGLNSSKLVDGTLKMTSTAFVHPAAVSEETVEEVGHLVINEPQSRSAPSQRKCRYMMHPPKQFSFGISICYVCS